MKAKLLRQLKRLGLQGPVQAPGVFCDPLLRFEKLASEQLCLPNPSNQEDRPILLNARPCAPSKASTPLIAVRSGAARQKNRCLTKCPFARTACRIYWD